MPQPLAGNVPSDQDQLQMARQRYTRLNAEKVPVPPQPITHSILGPTQVEVTFRNNVSPQSLHTSLVRITQHALALEEYSKGLVIGPPTSVTRGRDGVTRPDRPHITVKLSNRTIHIYISHNDPDPQRSVFITHAASRGANYNYSNLIAEPVSWFTNDDTIVTPKVNRIRQGFAAIKAANSTNALIETQISVVVQHMRELENRIRSQPNTDQQGFGAASTGYGGYDRGGGGGGGSGGSSSRSGYAPGGRGY